MRKSKPKQIDRYQIRFDQEIFVDLFSGGGGASMGIEAATGMPVFAAVNHNPDAIAMHMTNHPYTKHYQTSVWDVEPLDVCEGRPVGLLWASPDCTHFSKARGGKPVNKNIRSLSWVVLKWALEVRPRVLMMENVEEIQTWGPLIYIKRGKEKVWVPDPDHAGETFMAFIGMLTGGVPEDHPALEEACHYLHIGKDDYRRQKLVDGLGYNVEYRELVAADYGAPTTRKRFVLCGRCDGKPVVWPKKTHAPRNSPEVKNGKCMPWRSAAEIIDWSLPGYSIFESKEQIKIKYGVTAVRPLADNTMKRVICGVDKHTIRSYNPFLVECNHSGSGHIRDLHEPLNTVTGKHTGGVAQPIMVPWTVTNTTNSIGAPVSKPVHTVTSAGNQILASANLIQYHTETTDTARTSDLNQPINTVDASNRYGLATAQLVEYYGNGQSVGVSEPLHPVTSHDRDAVVMTHIQEFYGCSTGNDASEPLSTVMSKAHHGLCAAHVVKFKGQELGTNPADPLPTVVAQSGSGGYAECRAVLAKVDRCQNLGHWPKIRSLLNKYCGYRLQDNEIILLLIDGIAYFIADILLRMLTPRELYNAMGFPPDYIIARDHTGKPYPKNKQVARCGNAVCPPMAEAMVRANFPEYCIVDISTLAELMSLVSI